MSQRREQLRFRPRSRSRSPPSNRRKARHSDAHRLGSNDRDHNRSSGHGHYHGKQFHGSVHDKGRGNRGADRQAEDHRHHSRRSHCPVSAERHGQFGRHNARGSGASEGVAAEKRAPEKQKVNMALSGKLAEDTNTYKGIVIKYNEPADACKPRRLWRLYPFKGEEALPVLYIHRQSGYLVGRERKIADIPLDHPSISKQHAVIQYRRVDCSGRQVVRPYVMDLCSANGTFVNNKSIEPQRFVELRERDMLKFGFSSREYILLHDRSAGMQADD